MRAYLILVLILVMKVNLSFAEVNEKVDCYIDQFSNCGTFGILSRVSSTYIETEYGCLGDEDSRIDRYRYPIKDSKLQFENENHVFENLSKYFLNLVNEGEYFVSESKYATPHTAVERYIFSKNKFKNFRGRQVAE